MSNETRQLLFCNLLAYFGWNMGSTRTGLMSALMVVVMPPKTSQERRQGQPHIWGGEQNSDGVSSTSGLVLHTARM